MSKDADRDLKSGIIELKKASESLKLARSDLDTVPELTFYNDINNLIDKIYTIRRAAEEARYKRNSEKLRMQKHEAD